MWLIFNHSCSHAETGTGEARRNNESTSTVRRSVFRTKAKAITSAKRLQIGSERLIVVALSLWLAGCNNQRPAAHGPPPAEVTVSKPEPASYIKTGQLAEGLRVVKSGLQPDDVVIINGIIKVRPDSPVRPQQGAMEQFSSNDISMPRTNSQSSASHGDADRNKATP
jgi:hypothetical protein